MEPLNLPTYFYRIKEDKGKKYIFDEIRRRYVQLTHEEWVRQHVVHYLVAIKNFPLRLIAVEKGFRNNKRNQRYDLLVYTRTGSPLMIVECKAPGIDINQRTFDQANRYNHCHKASYMLITNGMKHYCCEINLLTRQYRFLPDIPAFEVICPLD